MTSLTLIRGIPGSGKTTLAKKLLLKTGVHFEADMFFEHDGKYNFVQENLGQAHAWCKSQCDDSLHYGMDVIVSNTFTTLKELRPYFEIASKYKIVPHVILCQGNYNNIHNVPIEVLEKMKNRFEYDISSLF